MKLQRTLVLNARVSKYLALNTISGSWEGFHLKGKAANSILCSVVRFELRLDSKTFGFIEERVHFSVKVA